MGKFNLEERETNVFSNYKNAETILKRSRSGFNSMSAAVVFIPDQSEITHIEMADYRNLTFDPYHIL